MSKLLYGKTYDFSKNASIYTALSDLLTAFGAVVNNVPTQNI